MPRRVNVAVRLPAAKPKRCVECPLLGMLPKGEREPYSKETLICLGMAGITGCLLSVDRATKSEGETKWPLRRPCDRYWEMWQDVYGGEVTVSVAEWQRYRKLWEYEQQRRLPFRKCKANADLFDGGNEVLPFTGSDDD